MGDTADVVVIGAGVIGCSVAYALAGRGHAVLVVDRLGGPGQGSTSASSAIIRYNYSTPAGVLTAWESHFAWLDWPGHLGGSDTRTATFYRTGYLCLDSPTQNTPAVLALFDRYRVPYRTVTAAQIRQRYPWIDPARHYPPKPIEDEAFWDESNGEVSGYLNPDAGFVDDPGFAAHNLYTAAGRLGARFRFKAAVAAVNQAGGRVSGVTLADGSRIEAPVVVNVAGPHSGQVNALAGVGGEFSVATRPLRVEVDCVPAPPGYHTDNAPGPVVADLDLGTYWRGSPSPEIYLGGTEPECDPLDWLEDPDDYQPQVSAGVYRTQVYRVARRIPGLTVPNTPRGIVGIYDVTDDWIPIYDRTDLPGYYVAIGTSGNQFKNAPVVGGYLTAIIEACENGRDHDTDPVTVHLPHTGADLDLSVYSRKRPPTTASSNTVMG